MSVRMNKPELKKEQSISSFNKDVAKKGGYEYTNLNKLSAHMANQRITLAIHKMVDFYGKKIIDIGCGDGTYTAEFVEEGADFVLGIDAAEVAIESASIKYKSKKNIAFKVCNIYDLSSVKDKFDIAIVRGILHHLYDAPKAISEICKVANTVIVLEPNGYNPVLKIIEKTSPYHIEHEEKSYFPATLDDWFEHAGAKVVARKYIGLVPMFCPDWMCKVLKFIEPIVEATPLVRTVSCGQYIQRIEVEGSIESS